MGRVNPIDIAHGIHERVVREVLHECGAIDEKGRLTGWDSAKIDSALRSKGSGHTHIAFDACKCRPAHRYVNTVDVASPFGATGYVLAVLLAWLHAVWWEQPGLAGFWKIVLTALGGPVALVVLVFLLVSFREQNINLSNSFHACLSKILDLIFYTLFFVPLWIWPFASLGLGLRLLLSLAVIFPLAILIRRRSVDFCCLLGLHEWKWDCYCHRDLRCRASRHHWSGERCDWCMESKRQAAANRAGKCRTCASALGKFSADCSNCRSYVINLRGAMLAVSRIFDPDLRGLGGYHHAIEEAIGELVRYLPITVLERLETCADKHEIESHVEVFFTDASYGHHSEGDHIESSRESHYDWSYASVRDAAKQELSRRKTRGVPYL